MYSNFNHGEECSKAELDISRKQPVQTAIERSTWDKIEPTNSWDKNTIIEFIISGSNDKYIDLSQVQLFLEFKILKNDVDELPINVPVSVVNNLMHSLFKNIETKIGTTPVSNTSDKYHYKAYFENLLGYNKESKSSLLRGDGWYKDSVNFESFDLENKDAVFTSGTLTTAAKIKNPGFVTRHNLVAGNKTIQLCGNLHLDVSTIDKLILNNNDVSLYLKKNDPAFYMLGDEDKAKLYKAHFLKAHILVRRVSVAPSVMYANTLSLDKNPAYYPLKRVTIKDIVASFNSTSASFQNIASGIMPVRVLVGFVESEAFTGKYNKNPFNFQNFGIKSAELKVNSVATPFSSPLEFNFAENIYHQGYSTLFKCIKEAPNDIDYDEYPMGNMILAFNLSPDLCTQDHLSLYQDGKLELKVIFETALQKSITAVFYLEYDSLIQINKSGQIVLDYTA